MVGILDEIIRQQREHTERTLAEIVKNYDFAVGSIELEHILMKNFPEEASIIYSPYIEDPTKIYAIKKFDVEDLLFESEESEYKEEKTMKTEIDKKDFIEKHRRWLYIAVDNYIPSILGIPENPTNGELIEAMFPDGKIWKSGNYMCLLTNGQCDVQMFDLDWWNTLYKKGAKEC